MAMADITISCTSLDKATRVSSDDQSGKSPRLKYEATIYTRMFMCVCFALQAEVMDLVQLMGGRVYLDLNVSVTHLIAGEVGSKKYLVAASLGKPILLPTWVKTCWEKSQDRYVKSQLY